MSRVTYTEVFAPDSSLVEGVYYDANTRELTVVLHDELYRYSGVGKSTVEAFKNARSAGRFYTSTVKRNYGPGEYLGSEWDADYDEVSEGAAPDMSAPLYDATKATIDTKGTPKGLTYAEGAVITNVGETGNASTFSLTPAPVLKTARKHKVAFDTPNGRREHTLLAESVEDAAGEIVKLGDMLDLDFDVKEVTVYFE